MFSFRKKLTKNPGNALKNFAKEMMNFVGILIVICAVIGLPVVTSMIFSHNYLVASIVIVVGILFIIAQHIFMVTTYGILYGIGSLIDNSKEQVKLLGYKSKNEMNQLAEHESGIVEQLVTNEVEPMYEDIEFVAYAPSKEDRAMINGDEETVTEQEVDVVSEEGEPVYNNIEAINENFYLANRSDKDEIITKEGKIIYSGKDIKYIAMGSFIALKGQSGWCINDRNGEAVIRTKFDSVRYDGYEKILVKCATPIKQEEEAIYFMTKYREEDRQLPDNYYILSTKEDGELIRNSDNEIILRGMVYSFEYNLLPSEWRELIAANE